MQHDFIEDSPFDMVTPARRCMARMWEETGSDDYPDFLATRMGEYDSESTKYRNNFIRSVLWPILGGIIGGVAFRFFANPQDAVEQMYAAIAGGLLGVVGGFGVGSAPELWVGFNRMWICNEAIIPFLQEKLNLDPQLVERVRVLVLQRFQVADHSQLRPQLAALLEDPELRVVSDVDKVNSEGDPN